PHLRPQKAATTLFSGKQQRLRPDPKHPKFSSLPIFFLVGKRTRTIHAPDPRHQPTTSQAATLDTAAGPRSQRAHHQYPNNLGTRSASIYSGLAAPRQIHANIATPRERRARKAPPAPQPPANPRPDLPARRRWRSPISPATRSSPASSTPRAP
uniref:Uncharacterized protein n=1 Tax=Aegilops tauschii subsp. strangulata TaxID=200361 RepID=A0A453PQT5_AEGTS